MALIKSVPLCVLLPKRNDFDSHCGWYESVLESEDELLERIKSTKKRTSSAIIRSGALSRSKKNGRASESEFFFQSRRKKKLVLLFSLRPELFLEDRKRTA